MAPCGGMLWYGWPEVGEDVVEGSERLIWLLVIACKGLMVVESTL